MGKLTRVFIAWLLLSGVAFAADYHVRPDGNDATCDGLSDEEAGDGSCSYATIGKAWTISATVNADNTITVHGGSEGSPVTYSEAASIGGADTGNTLTINIDAYTIIKAKTYNQGYLFRVGEATTTVNINGQAGWPKTVEVDIGLDGDSGTSVVNCPLIYTNQAATTVVISDIDYNAVGATATGRLQYASAFGYLSITYNRCYINHFDTVQSNIATGGSTTFNACYFEDCDPFKNIVIGTDSENMIVRNCTFYDNNGTSNRTSIVISSIGTNAHTIDIRNNLFISNVAVGTLYPPIAGGNDEFRSFGGTLTVSNNAAWKTALRGTLPRGINAYPYIAAHIYAGVDPDYWGELYTNLLIVDPDAGTLPAINATSLLIGRGANTGVANDIRGTAYPSDSIGCYAVSGGTKQYLTQINNRILITGHSYVDNTGGNEKWPDDLWLETGMDSYTLLGAGDTVCQPSNPVCWAQFSGSAAYRNAGAYTELTQLQTPEIVIYNADGNSWNLLGTAWGVTLEESIIQATINNILSLYAPGDVKIIYLGSLPDDALTNTSTRADEIEAAMDTYCTATDYVWCGNMLSKFKAANPADWGSVHFKDWVHPIHSAVNNGNGTWFIADWLATLIIGTLDAASSTHYVRADGTGAGDHTVSCATEGTWGISDIAYGVGDVVSGDTVIFCDDGGAIFYGAIPTVGIGEVTFRAETGATVTISGEATGLSWANVSGTIYKAALVSDNHEAATYPNRAFWGDVELTWNAVPGAVGANEYSHDGTHVYVDIGKDPTGEAMHIVKLAGQFNSGGFDNLLVDGLTFKYAAQSAINIASGSDNMRIEGCTFTRNSQAIYTSGATNVLIDGNTFTDFAADPALSPVAYHAIYLDDASNDAIIQHNTFTSGKNNAIQLSDGSDRTKIRFNTSTGNAGPFLQLVAGAIADTEVSFNISNGDTRFYLEGIGGCTTALIEHNTAYAYTALGLSASYADSQIGSLRNNIIYSDASASHIAWTNAPTLFSGNNIKGEAGGTDPLLVSAADMHLKGSSTMKSGGTNLGTGYTDYAGVNLPTPYGWPIGAYSYNSFGGGTGSFSGSIQ